MTENWPHKLIDKTFVKLTIEGNPLNGKVGVLWAVYGLDPVQYEATFFDDNGEEEYFIFGDEDAEKIERENVKDQKVLNYFDGLFGN